MQGKLIKSFFRKDLSHMVSFMLLIILTSLMLQLGICLITGYQDHFEKSSKEANAADLRLYTSVYPGDYYTYDEVMAPVFDYLDTCEGIDHYCCRISHEVNGMLVDETGGDDSKNIDDFRRRSFELDAYGEWGEMDTPKFIEEIPGEFEHPLYLSYNLQQGYFNGNYNVGDEITIDFDGVEYPFVLKGIYETFGEDDVLFTDENTLNELTESEDYRSYYFYLRLDEGTDINDFVKKLNEDISRKQLYLGMVTLPELISDATYMINIISSLLCVFSVVITLVIVAVIYFRVTNSIEQNIVNLGALKALGYTGRQIRNAYVEEFVLTSGVGLLISTAILYAGFPMLEEVLRTFAESKWDPPFNPMAFAVSALFIVGSTLGVSFFSASKIRDIEPVTALRFGLKSHSFKRNVFPIETTPGSLVGTMSLKGAFGNKRQGVLTAVIMTVVGITLSVAVFIGYNISYKPMNLYRLLLGSPYHVEFLMREDVDINDFLSIDGVDKAWTEDSFNVTLKGTKLFFTTSEDWSKVPVQLVEGRVPLYDNEVVIGMNPARANDIRLGDEVELTANGITKSFVVTGLNQSVVGHGNVGLMSNTAARGMDEYINEGHVCMTIEGADLETSLKVIREVEAIYGDQLGYYINSIESVESGNDEYVSTGGAICIGLVAVSVVVVLLSMALLVKTMIIKHQKELGIKKAIGFTSGQLRLELTVSMMPHIGLGLLIGSVIGGLNSNRLLDFLLAKEGVVKSNLDFSYWMPLLSVVIGLLVSLVIIYVFSRKIKRITAYSLISE